MQSGRSALDDKRLFVEQVFDLSRVLSIESRTHDEPAVRAPVVAGRRVRADASLKLVHQSLDTRFIIALEVHLDLVKLHSATVSRLRSLRTKSACCPCRHASDTDVAVGQTRSR